MNVTVETKAGIKLVETTVYELLLLSFMASGDTKIVLNLGDENLIVKADGIIQKKPEYFEE